MALVFCAKSHGLQCLFKENVTETQINDLNATAFFNAIKNLSSISFNDTDLCRIKLHIAFSRTPYITTRLTNHLADSDVTDSEVEIHFTIKNSGGDNRSVSHFIEYACSYDECDKDFIGKFNKSLEWWFNARYTNLSNKIAKFIVADEETSNEEGSYHFL